MLPREHYLKQAFQDLVHFPNGFEKGGLSDIQARLVRKNGTLINALCIDEVSDPTTEDLHILKVIANQSSPKNPVEQAWIKYLSLVKNIAAANPKSKGKVKAAKAEPAPEATKPIEKAEKTPPVAEKKSEKAAVSKATTTKKAEPEPAEVKPKAKPVAKAEPKAPVKAATKVIAEPKKAEAKKTEIKKTEVTKAEPQKTEPKKAASKQAEPKKPESKKPEQKKPSPTKPETKKPEPKVAAKKAEPAKPAAKKTTKTK